MKKTKSFTEEIIKKYNFDDDIEEEETKKDDMRKKDTPTKIPQSVRKKDSPTKISQSVRKKDNTRKKYTFDDIEDDIEDFDDKKSQILTNMV